jgi:multidrug transporter EmrE-like cation transporter
MVNGVSNVVNQKIPLVYGTYMAKVDVFMFSLLKAINLGWINKAAIFLPTLIYAMQPWVFLSALKYESMTVMNLLWDVMSDVLVTFTGLFFFKETLTRTKMIGVGFAFVAVFLLTCGDFCG